MTKTEMVEKLYAAGVGTKTALRKKDEEELTKLVSELEQNADETHESGTEEETPTPVKEVTAKEGEGEVVFETKHQIGIFTEFIYHVQNTGAKVKIENLGGGDVYVGDKDVRVGMQDLRLIANDSRVFEGHTVIHMIAASQPEVKITEIK